MESVKGSIKKLRQFGPLEQLPVQAHLNLNTDIFKDTDKSVGVHPYIFIPF